MIYGTGVIGLVLFGGTAFCKLLICQGKLERVNGLEPSTYTLAKYFHNNRKPLILLNITRFSGSLSVPQFCLSSSIKSVVAVFMAPFMAPL